MGKEEEGTGARNRAQFILGSVAVNRTCTGSAPSSAYCEVLDGLPGSFHPLQGPHWAACRVIARLPPGLLSFPTHCLALPGCIGSQFIAWLLPDYVESIPVHECLPPLPGRTACSPRSLLDPAWSCMEHFHCMAPTGSLDFSDPLLLMHRDLIHMPTTLLSTHLVT